MNNSSADVVCSQAEQQCKIRASVTTGFEFLAVQEIKEKLHCESVQQGRGFVSWQMPISTSTKAMELRTVDNLLVMMAHFKDMPICKNISDKEKALELIENKIPNVDFETGLKVWSKFTDFQQEMSAKMASVSKPSNMCVEPSLADDMVTEAQTQTEILGIDAQMQTVVDQKNIETLARSYLPERNETTSDTEKTNEMPKDNSVMKENLEPKLMDLNRVEKNDQSVVLHMDRNMEEQNMCTEKETGDKEVQNADVEVQNAELKVQNVDVEVQNDEVEVQNDVVEVQNDEVKVQNADIRVQNVDTDIQNAEKEIENIDPGKEWQNVDIGVQNSRTGVQNADNAMQDADSEIQNPEMEMHSGNMEVQSVDIETQDEILDGWITGVAEHCVKVEAQSSVSEEEGISAHSEVVEPFIPSTNKKAEFTSVKSYAANTEAADTEKAVDGKVSNTVEPKIVNSHEANQSVDGEVKGDDREVLSTIDVVHNAEAKNGGKDNKVQSAHDEVIQSSEDQSNGDAVLSIEKAVQSAIELDIHHTDEKEESDTTSLISEPSMRSAVFNEPEQELSQASENANLEKFSYFIDGEKDGFCSEGITSGALTVTSDNLLVNAADGGKDDDTVKVDNTKQVCNNESQSESKFVHSSVPKEEVNTSEKSAVEKTKDELDQPEKLDNVFCGDEAVSADPKGSDDQEQLMAERNKIRKILCSKADVDNKDSLSFRATCNRAGDHHAFGSPDVSKRVGGAIGDRFEWRVDLKNYDVEVDNNVSFGLSLTRESLHRRNISSFGRTTLRGTLCAGLLRLADVRPGEIVLDPLCGTGGITIEGAIEYPESFHIAGDNQQFCVDCSRENLDEMNRVRKALNLDLLKASAMLMDARHLPLPTSFVDVIVTDMPFGKKHGNKFDNRKLYPAILTEAARVCKPGSGRMVLLTIEKSLMTKVVTSNKQWWYLRRSCFVNHGGLNACAYLLKRTGKEWCDPSDPHYRTTTERTAGFGACDIRQNVERRFYNASAVSKEKSAPLLPAPAVLTEEPTQNVPLLAVKVADNSIESQMEKKSTDHALTDDIKNLKVEAAGHLEENKEGSARAVVENVQLEIQDKEPTTSDHNEKDLTEKMDTDNKNALAETSSQNSEPQEKGVFGRQSYQRFDDRYGYGWHGNRRGFGGGRETRLYRYEPVRRNEYRGDYQGRNAKPWHGDGDYHPRKVDRSHSSQQHNNDESQCHANSQAKSRFKKKKPLTEEQKLKRKQKKKESRQLKYQSEGQTSGRTGQSAGGRTGSEGHQVKSNSSLPHD